MATAPYSWKSTNELAQKNQANTMAKAMAGNSPKPFGAAATSAAPTPTAAPGMAQPGAMPGASPGVTPFAMPKTMAEAMRGASAPPAAPAPSLESNLGLAQENIAAGFKPGAAGPADDLARNEFQKTLDANTRATLEKSALSGRGRTGQLTGDLVNYMQQSAIPAKMDLEANLQANRMKDDAQRAQAAQGNLLGLANLESQEKLGLAGISSQEKMQDKDITSKEKLGFADLSIREKSLAQEGANFKDELAFKKYATDRGFTDAEAARAWQSREAEKEIASREKVSFAQLSQQEKELAQKAKETTDRLAWDKEALRLGLDDKTADRVWQGAENQKEREARATDSSLNRELQKYLGDRGLDIDEQEIAENIRQFDSRQEFDKWATQAGLDANAAELVWKSNESDVARKWESGERLSTQEHQVNLSRLDSELETGRMQLQQALNLETVEKQQAHDKVVLGLENEYQTLRDTTAMNHDQVMESIKNSYVTQLTKMGFDQETALQAAEIQAKQMDGALNRGLEADLARAELAYKYKSLQSEIGLNEQEIQLKKDGMAQDLTLGLKQLGLDETKIKAAISSQEFQDRTAVLATFMEMSGDNPDAINKAATAFVAMLGDPKLPGGALIKPEEMQPMIDAIIKAEVSPVVTKPAQVNGRAGNRG